MAGDVIPLKGREWKGRFRKRVGSYRIIFTMDRSAMVVAVSPFSFARRRLTGFSRILRSRIFWGARADQCQVQRHPLPALGHLPA